MKNTIQPNTLNEAVVNLESMTDEQLMLSYCNGEAAAFNVLYARHKGSLFRYLLRQLGQGNEQVNELFQDIWLSLVNARQRYQPSARFTTYLYRIAHNRLVDYWRSRQSVSTTGHDPDNVEDAGQQPDDCVLQEQNHQLLKQQIAALPEEQRSAFLLKEEASLTLAQIADITGVNRETVKSRLRYAIQRLRQSLVATL